MNFISHYGAESVWLLALVYLAFFRTKRKKVSNPKPVNEPLTAIEGFYLFMLALSVLSLSFFVAYAPDFLAQAGHRELIKFIFPLFLLLTVVNACFFAVKLTKISNPEMKLVETVGPGIFAILICYLSTRWSLFPEHPEFENVLKAVFITSVLFLVRRKQVAHTEIGKARVRSIQEVNSFFFFSIFVFLVLAQYFIAKTWHPLIYAEYRWRIFVPSIVIALLINSFASVRAAWIKYVDPSWRVHEAQSPIIPVVILILALACDVTGEILNVVLDRTGGVTAELPILERDQSVSLSFESLIHEHIYVVRMTEVRSPASVSNQAICLDGKMDRALYNQISIGKSRVRVTWHPGALGVSWYENAQIVP